MWLALLRTVRNVEAHTEAQVPWRGVVGICEQQQTAEGITKSQTGTNSVLCDTERKN